MRVVNRKRLSVGEWLVGGVLLVSTVAATEFLGVSQKWENAIVYTFLVFTALIIGFRPAWGRKAFWRDLALACLLHVLCIVIIYRAVPSDSEGLHGLPLVAVGMAEATLLVGVLWKRVMKSNSRFS